MKTYSLEATITAPVEKCYQAFTQESEIPKWLGTAKACTKPNEDYLLSAPLPYLSGRHKIIAITPNKTLHLTHYIQGHPTDLTIHFTPIKNKTKITLTLTAETKNAPPSIEPFRNDGQLFYFIGQAWATSIKKLRAHLEDNSPGVIITPHNNDHFINLYIDIHTTPEKIWKSLTDAELLKKQAPEFHTEGTQVEPKAGGIYTYGWYPKDTPEAEMEDGPSKILAYEKNKKLTINWHGGQKMSEVTYTLEQKDKDTIRLHFKHSPLLGHSHGNIWSYRNGWTEHLYTLKWFTERNEAESTWFKSTSAN